MVKFVTPLLILIVEVFGVFDLIMPEGENGRAFDPDGLAIVLTAATVIVVAIAVYFIFFSKKETGTNEDERIVIGED